MSERIETPTLLTASSSPVIPERESRIDCGSLAWASLVVRLRIS